MKLSKLYLMIFLFSALSLKLYANNKNIINFEKLRLQDKKTLAMGGFGGQQLIIDFDKKRIIAITSNDRHYDWKNIVHEVLKR